MNLDRFALLRRPMLAAVLVLTACTGPPEPPDPPDPTGLTVEGTLVDVDGAGLSGLLVFIPGHPTEVSADDGSFRFDEVESPYDLTVVDPETEFTHTFVGLTSADPLVRPLGPALTASIGKFSGSITGDFIHGVYAPLPADHRARVCAEGVGRLVVGCTTVGLGSSFTLFPSWSGNASVTVRLRVIVSELNGDGEAIGIVATGVSAPIALSDGGAEHQDVTLADDTAQESVSVTVSVPTGYTLISRELISTYSEFGSISPTGDASTAATSNAITPSLPGATYTVVAAANNDDIVAGNTTIAWSAAVDPSDAVDLTLPEPATPVSPEDMATGVDHETVFAMDNPAGGVLTFVFSADTMGQPSFVVTTSASSVTIPDLAVLGVALPSAASYTWQVLSTPAVASTDAAVSESGYVHQYSLLSRITQGGAPAPSASGSISSSPVRHMTTD